MKAIVITLCLVTASLSGFTQSKGSKSNKTDVARVKPLYVLKAEERIAIIDPAKGEKFDIESIDPSWIKAVDVLKGENAIKEYGEKASNGVVIIYFKDYYILSKEVHAFFENNN
jgi:hypothetical protein